LIDGAALIPFASLDGAALMDKLHGAGGLPIGAISCPTSGAGADLVRLRPR
jgi:hypothetical protein